jgi:hypothetical protein
MTDQILSEIRGNCVSMFAGCVLVHNRLQQLVDSGLIPILVHIIGECMEGIGIPQSELADTGEMMRILCILHCTDINCTGGHSHCALSDWR